MADAWQTLRDGGLPLAIEGAGTRPDTATLAASARDAIARQPRGRDAEALAAWLIAWRDHWPTSFRSCFVADLEAVEAWAERHASDAGRRVKLRRIALERLAAVL
jgi:hypothetical protein